MTFKERLNREYAKENELAANDNDPEITGFDSEYFGIDNIKSYPACLVLRFSDSSQKGIPYSCIVELDYEPGEGMVITTSNKTIKIIGRDLEKLFDYITAFRVRYIQENVGADTTESGLFVKEIAILEL